MNLFRCLVTMAIVWRALRMVSVVQRAVSKKLLQRAITTEFYYACIIGIVLCVVHRIWFRADKSGRTIGSGRPAYAWERSHSSPMPRVARPLPTALDRHLLEHAAQLEQEALRAQSPASNSAPTSIGSLFALSAKELHSLAQRASDLSRRVAQSRAMDPIVTERERELIHREVHSVLASFNAPHEGFEPRIVQLPESAVNLDGRVNSGRAKNLQSVSNTVYDIEIRLPQSRTRYAWVYAHEYSHIIVHGHALASQAVGESAREEALAELLALLCVVRLSEKSPNAHMYSREVVAQTLHVAFAAADDASQYSSFAQSRAERVAHIYGGGLRLAIEALLQNPTHSLDENFLPYFLRSHFAGGPLPAGSCIAHTANENDLSG